MLFLQNFPAYEILFIVDDETDAAVAVINDLIGGSGKKNVSAKLIIAGKAIDSSQKVHNLRAAIPAADEKSKVFVFVDSDARPNENWLKHLTAPLRNEKIGCATGYRWFISRKGNFASEMCSVWNASIASALGANQKSNFCWGGSMAISRGVFEKLEIREKWNGVLSDDFAVTRAMQNAELPVYFVPQALTASIEDFNFKGLFEFTTRQMKITRVYAPKLWMMSLIGSFLFNFVMIWSLLNLVFFESNSFAFWFAVSVLALVTGFSFGKSYLRMRAVKLILTDYKDELRRQMLIQNVLWVVSPALFFYNAVSALFSKKIVWRGISYELISPHHTSKLSD